MLNTISLFSGIGGLDFGFEAAGFNTRVALEFNKQACDAMRLNHGWAVIEDDIHNISSEVLLKAAKLKRGQADMLIGGPPCQPFSKSSYWARGDARRLDDPRADTLTAYLRVLRDTKPRAFLIENVYGLAYEGKDEGLRYLLDGIDDVNREAGTKYKASWRVIKCAEYGVPQIRERVFIIGSRDGREFRFPEPTHAKPEDLGQDLFSSRQPYRTAWDALGGLSSIDPDEREALQVGGKWAELLPSIPEGQNYLWHTPRGGGVPLFGWRTRYWSFLLKLSKRLPSWTVQAQPGASIGPFHWDSRKLTFEEMCRIQTFPEGLQVNCGRTEMQRMLGNAVPSLIGEILAREIRSQLLDAPTYGDLKLLPPRRHDTPPPVRLKAVPRKFMVYAGDHAAHPGTGKGRQAIARAPRVEQVQLNS